MSLVNNIRDFCMKHKRIVCLIIFIILAIFLSKLTASMKEGIDGIKLSNCSELNSKGADKNCANCLGVVLSERAAADGNKCFWNDTTKQCGSFSGAGFKDTCTNTSTTPASSANVCTSATCPNLKLLDTPTWFADPILKSGNLPKLSLVDTPTWITKV